MPPRNIQGSVDPRTAVLALEGEFKANVAAYRALQVKIDTREKELRDLKSQLENVEQKLANVIHPGRRQLVKVGRALVLVENPLETRVIHVEQMNAA